MHIPFLRHTRTLACKTLQPYPPPSLSSVQAYRRLMSLILSRLSSAVITIRSFLHPGGDGPLLDHSPLIRCSSISAGTFSGEILAYRILDFPACSMSTKGSLAHIPTHPTVSRGRRSFALQFFQDACITSLAPAAMPQVPSHDNACASLGAHHQILQRFLRTS